MWHWIKSKLPWYTKEIIDCKYKESCRCTGIKPHSCNNCNWYFSIDSGYGYCKTLPTYTVVPWCRDACSLFKKRVKKEVNNGEVAT